MSALDERLRRRLEFKRWWAPKDPPVALPSYADLLLERLDSLDRRLAQAQVSAEAELCAHRAVAGQPPDYVLHEPREAA